jgi:methionine-rich copper-binding protein CopC/putative copper export protein
MRRTIFLFFFAALVSLLPNAVLAHAIPITYEASSSSVLESTPSEVRIRFSERLEKSASSIKVFAPDGSRADISLAQIDINDARALSVPIRLAGMGGYAVAWQVVSADDGHFSKGGFSFSVGSVSGNSASPTVDVAHNSGYAEASAIWLELLGESIFLSAFILFMFLLRPIHRKLGMALGKEYPFFEKRFALIVSCSLILVCIGSLIFFTLKSTELSNLQNVSFGNGAASFSRTIAGEFALIRIFLSLALLVLFLTRWKKMLVSEKITREEIIFFLSALVLATLRARLSHAAADSFHPHFSIFVNFLHMMGKGFLVGAPAVVAIAFAPALKRCGLPRSTAEIVSGFSRLAAFALALAGVTGAYIIWLHLKGFGNLLNTQWGTRLMFLLASFAGLFLIRMYHHFFADKDARDFVETGNKNKDCHRHFYFAEAIAGALVSFFSALIIITTPPLTTGPFTLAGEGNGAAMILSEYQDKNMMMDGMDMMPSMTLGGQEKSFLISVENIDGSPAHVKNFAVTLSNEKLGLGPILAEGHAMGDTFMFPESALSPSGDWNISIQAERENAYDAVAQFRLAYPDDIVDPKNARMFGAFETSLSLTALGIIIFSLFLIRRR